MIEDKDDLEARVHQFQAMRLPGQPQMMHMGTSYLVNDLWLEVKRLRDEIWEIKDEAWNAGVERDLLT